MAATDPPVVIQATGGTASFDEELASKSEPSSEKETEGSNSQHCYDINLEIEGQSTKNMLKNDCLTVTPDSVVIDIENQYSKKGDEMVVCEVPKDKNGKNKVENAILSENSIVETGQPDPLHVITYGQKESELEPNLEADDALKKTEKMCAETKSNETNAIPVLLKSEACSLVTRDPFNKVLFKDYTARGIYTEYVVWPVMFLHKNGPLLGKGVAQGTNEKLAKVNTDVLTWH